MTQSKCKQHKHTANGQNLLRHYKPTIQEATAIRYTNEHIERSVANTQYAEPNAASAPELCCQHCIEFRSGSNGSCTRQARLELPKTKQCRCFRAATSTRQQAFLDCCLRCRRQSSGSGSGTLGRPPTTCLQIRKNLRENCEGSRTGVRIGANVQ